MCLRLCFLELNVSFFVFQVDEFSLPPADIQVLELQFSAVAAAGGSAASTGDTSKESEDLQKQKDKQKDKPISLLDPKKLQNVLIALGKLRLSPGDVLRVVSEMGLKELTLEYTETLLSILPTTEEFAMVKAFAADRPVIGVKGTLG